MPYEKPDAGASGSSAIFLTTVDLSVPSACTVHVAAIAHGLAAAGWKVELFAPRLDSAPGVALDGDGVNVHWTYPLNRLGLPRTLSIFPMLAPLFSRTRRARLRLAYIRFSPLTPVLVWAVSKLAPHAAIVTEHNGWVASEASMSGWPRWLCRAVAWFQRADGLMCHAVRAVTDEVGGCLVNAGISPDKVFVAENGTDLQRFHPLDHAATKVKLGLDPTDLHVGFLGTLTPWQGVDVLLRAAATLMPHHPKLRVVVGGDGPGTAPMQALAAELGIADRVSFLGWVAAEQANTVINAFDIAVAPYHLPPGRPIGSPVKLRDYAAAGRPVVAADYPVVAHVSDEGWCLLHRPGDHLHMAKRIEELLGDEPRRETMGAQARRHAEANFGWASVIGTIISHIPNIGR